MKRIILSVLTMSALLCGCQKDHVSELAQGRGTIQATIEEISSTRTVMDEDNNIRWSEGDQIVGFMRSTLGVKYQVSAASVGKTSASFEEVSSGGLNAGTELEHIIAYYPYSSSVSAAKSGSNYTLDVILPTEQTYVAESFGNGAMPMVAVSETNNITFRNVCGGMKLQIKGTQKVASIKVEGKNGELLSGAATVTAYTDETKPAITMASGASTSVTLDCGSGVQLNESKATEFIIALPPVLFSKGFTATVTDIDGGTQAIGTDKVNEVKRSTILVMPAVTLAAPENEDPEIQSRDYVDEYGINHGQGVEIDGVVWAPVNCGYHATDYKYGKLYQWGRKHGQGYDSIDAATPEIMKGPISAVNGQSDTYSNVFFKISEYPYDWTSQLDGKLWNTGTDNKPEKTAYDPCPDGWRVPTRAELSNLRNNHSSWEQKDGKQGYWFSGLEPYTPTSLQVFLPATGKRDGEGNVSHRDSGGFYWSSSPDSDFENRTAGLSFFSSGLIQIYEYTRASGYSVRCVQE